jgi:hypothetical protein
MTAALPLTTPPPITMSFAIDSEFQQCQTNNKFNKNNCTI